MWASMSFRKLCCNSNAGRWIFHICYCCFEIMQVFFFLPTLRCKKEGEGILPTLLPKSSNLHFLFFLCTKLFKLHTFFCDLKQCGSCAYSNKATWWFLIPRQENRIIWLLRNEESERLWRESERGGGCDGGVGCMRVWEVGLAGFEINDLNMFSGRVSSQRKKCRQKHWQCDRGRQDGGGRQKFSSREKDRKRRRSLGAARPVPAEPRCSSKAAQQPCANVWTLSLPLTPTI